MCHTAAHGTMHEPRVPPGSLTPIKVARAVCEADSECDSFDMEPEVPGTFYRKMNYNSSADTYLANNTSMVSIADCKIDTSECTSSDQAWLACGTA